MKPDNKAAAGGMQYVALGAMALLVLVAIALAGMGRPAAGAAAPTSWLQDIETGADHIDAAELARELLAAPSDLLLVDVRPADEYAAFHLPFAVNLTVPDLLGEAGAQLLARNPRQVVLYSNGPAHPGQAWVELRRAGHQNVRVLDGGLDEFKARMLTPASLRGPVTEAQSKAEATQLLLYRAFFGLEPRRAAPGHATDPAQLTVPTAVSPAWLRRNLGKVAVLDARASADDYKLLHIPGAVHAPEKPLRERRGDRELMLKPPAELARQFGAMGLTRDTPVVIYAEDKMQDATMVAVALTSLGHQAVAILEGGLLAWAAAQQPLVAEVPKVVPQQYVPAPAPDVGIAIDDLAARVKAGSTQILDVRPPEFFRGEKSTEARPGHIPGSVNRPYQQDLVRDGSGHFWRPKAELEQDYAALGLKKDQPVVVSCRTGHTASESYFVLRHLLGYQDVRWFNSSWTEWAERKDLPAATGAGK